MTSSLPAVVCLSSVANGMYLRYNVWKEETHGLVEFKGKTFMGPYAIFEVEKSRKWDGLVHIKCRFNNKYLVLWSYDHVEITASAYAPEEDNTKWNCTLFKPISYDQAGKSIRLIHFYSYQYVGIGRNNPTPREYCLSILSETAGDVFTVFDWESLFMFPQLVAFMGSNGKYLGSNSEDGLQFTYPKLSDGTYDKKVVQHMFSSTDGTIYLQSEYTQKFWRANTDNKIEVNAEDPRNITTDTASSFRLAVLDSNNVAHVALFSMSREKFVSRDTDNDSAETATAKIEEISEMQVQLLEFKDGIYYGVGEES